MREPLTPGEWTVMAALWEKSPSTLSEVIKTIGDKVQWKYNTYASYLQILIRKGFADAEMRGRDKLYYPLADKDECIRLESLNVLKKIDKDAAKALVVNMIEQGGLSADDHAELIGLLESLMKKGGKT